MAKIRFGGAVQGVVAGAKRSGEQSPRGRSPVRDGRLDLRVAGVWGEQPARVRFATTGSGLAKKANKVSRGNSLYYRPKQPVA